MTSLLLSGPKATPQAHGPGVAPVFRAAASALGRLAGSSPMAGLARGARRAARARYRAALRRAAPIRAGLRAATRAATA